jgi:hypothetical protein
MTAWYEWLDSLTGWQVMALIGAAWFAVAVGMGVVGGKLMALSDEECDDECSLRIMREGECRHDQRRREVRRG